MTQPRMNFALDDAMPTDTHVTQPEEIARLATQTVRILDRLHKGPATNIELARISLKYTSRISDARRALEPIGKTVKVIRRDKGVSIYAIEDL